VGSVLKHSIVPIAYAPSRQCTVFATIVINQIVYQHVINIRSIFTHMNESSINIIEEHSHPTALFN